MRTQITYKSFCVASTSSDSEGCSHCSFTNGLPATDERTGRGYASRPRSLPSPIDVAVRYASNYSVRSTCRLTTVINLTSDGPSADTFALGSFDNATERYCVRGVRKRRTGCGGRAWVVYHLGDRVSSESSMIRYCVSRSTWTSTIYSHRKN